jgi:hypothetical protein
MQSRVSCLLLLAVLAAAAASVSAHPNRHLLVEESGKLISAVASMVDSKNAAVAAMVSAKADELHHKKRKMHMGKSKLPLAIHMDQHIPAAVLPNPSNPPVILANPTPVLPVAEIKLKHHKHHKHDKFDHKFDHHEDLLQMPLLSLPNPSNPPMPLPQMTKPSKHDKKALLMQMLDSKLTKFDHKFDHDKHHKHPKFDHKFDQVLPAPQVGFGNANPSNPPMVLPNPSQMPQVVMPAVATVKLSKHDKKALKVAAKLAKAAGVKVDQVAGVSVADVIMRNEPRITAPALLG